MNRKHYFQFIAIQDQGIMQFSACFGTQNTLLFKNTKIASESSYFLLPLTQQHLKVLHIKKICGWRFIPRKLFTHLPHPSVVSLLLEVKNIAWIPISCGHIWSTDAENQYLLTDCTPTQRRLTLTEVIWKTDVANDLSHSSQRTTHMGFWKFFVNSNCIQKVHPTNPLLSVTKLSFPLFFSVLYSSFTLLVT